MAHLGRRISIMGAGSWQELISFIINKRTSSKLLMTTTLVWYIFMICVFFHDIDIMILTSWYWHMTWISWNGHHYMDIRLIHYSFYCTYQPRHLTWVSQLYVKWFGTKERSVRVNWATRLWITPLPSKINAKKIENEKVCFQNQNFIWGDFKPQKWIPG